MFRISDSFCIITQQVYKLHVPWMFSGKLINNITCAKMFRVTMYKH